VIWDGYPVSAGHNLVISKRHIYSFFEVIAPERAALLALLDKAKDLVEQDHPLAGYNIG
jgi:diadenosine tetraphosphate (Ap4A) HIT family hydrolase